MVPDTDASVCTRRCAACDFANLRIDWGHVPKTSVMLYREESGSCPFVEWFDTLPAKVQDKCYLRLERLREKGSRATVCIPTKPIFCVTGFTSCA
jgi:hypothetical protein